MSALLRVDTQKCQRDGACLAECPAGIIRFGKADGFPEPVPGAEAFCIHCGHCVAVCPHGALSHVRITPADCAPIEETLIPTPPQVEQFLRARRSVRAFARQPLDREQIVRLIDTARFAPSGHNLQPVHWRVIYDRAAVAVMAGHVVDWMRHLIAVNNPLAALLHMERAVAAHERGREPILRGAPHLVVAHAPKVDRTAPPACTIALAYLELAASTHGLGACWAGYFNTAAGLWPPLQAALALPAEHASFGALMLGRPRFVYHRIPPRNPARVTWT
jgi:nitroreductase/NAD-dependent dihydropyrimidine dehydrogenase PreA subunit